MENAELASTLILNERRGSRINVRRNSCQRLSLQPTSVPILNREYPTVGCWRGVHTSEPDLSCAVLPSPVLFVWSIEHATPSHSRAPSRSENTCIRSWPPFASRKAMNMRDIP